MKRRIPFISLLVLFLLPTPASANAGWPMLMIAAAPVALWYIGVASVLIEEIILLYTLQLTWGKALLMSIVANAASLVAGLLVGGIGIGYLGETSLIESDVIQAIVGSLPLSLLVMFALTIAVEITVIKVLWKYDWRQLWIPILAGNLLTYIIMFVLMMSPID